MSQPSSSANPTALVVDDEAPLAAIVVSYLQREGFAARALGQGDAAVAAARAERPDLVILDLGLPGIDGIEVCRQIRTFSDCYIIMLTARAEEVDTLIGLSVGADDYVVKPFSPRELMARVKTLFRRPRSAGGPEPALAPLRIGQLALDPDGREARVAGEAVELTRTEFDILAVLAAHPGRVFSRDQILQEVWGSDWYGDAHVVDVHVAHIRAKLGEAPGGADGTGAPGGADAGGLVKTVRGVGYKIAAGG